MRRPWTHVLFTLAGMLLALGLVAGVLNRQVLDGGRFAAHADAVRSDDRVSQLVGVAITDELIRVDQNLVALRPAVEAVMIQLVRSSVFTPIVRGAARQVHDALTHAGSGQILLRLADVGAVVIAALKALAPDIATRLPADFDVRLADVGSQSFASSTLHLARLVGAAAWLLPVLALLMLLIAIAFSATRQRTVATAGLVVAAAGLGVGVLAAAVATVVSAAGTPDLRSALVAAAWAQLAPAFWTIAFVTLLSGWLVFAAAGALLPQLSILALPTRVVRWLARPGPRPAAQLASAAVLIALGAAVLYRPGTAARITFAALALVLIAEGIGRVARVSAAQAAQSEQAEQAAQSDPDKSVARRRPRRWLTAGIGVLGVLGLLGGLAIAAQPASRQVAVPGPVATVDARACNGHRELCGRRYTDVAYVATHNSMSAADQQGWFIPEQPTGLVGQLDAGVRTLLIDAWYGQATDRPGVITNAGAGSAEALAQANAEYGAPVVQSALRLRAALNLQPRGPVQPYLCHQLCALGATPMVAALQGVQRWLAGHPRDVVTFIIEDYISAGDTAQALREAGLLAYVHTQTADRPWPTLGQLIDSGQRLQVFAQSNAGGAANPWLLKAWDWIQDTPYDNPSRAALSCDRLRGGPSNPLLLMNNILTRFATRVSDSATINAFGVLWPYAARCEQQRGQIPNFVAVDYYSKGNVFAVVDRLNRVG